MAEVIEETLAAIVHLKVDRDTWRAVAEKYKAAFEEQVGRFDELRDICIATQAELENTRTLNRPRPGPSASNFGGDDAFDDARAGLAMTVGATTHLVPSTDNICQQSAPNSRPCLRHVEELALNRDYGTALKEVECLLQSPLAPESRIESLLLQSNLMRKLEWLYDALAACDEGIELCNRSEDLRSYLPGLRYQQGLCYDQLNMLQARDALDQVSTVDGSSNDNASTLRTSYEDHLEARRRSGFEMSRPAMDGLLSPGEHGFASKRKRTSLQALRPKRLFLPQRRVMSRPESSGLQ